MLYSGDNPLPFFRRTLRWSDEDRDLCTDDSGRCGDLEVLETLITKQMASEEVREMHRQLFVLTARRSIRPSIEDSAKMRQLMSKLYEETGDELYKI